MENKIQKQCMKTEKTTTSISELKVSPKRLLCQVSHIYWQCFQATGKSPDAAKMLIVLAESVLNE